MDYAVLDCLIRRQRQMGIRDRSRREEKKDISAEDMAFGLAPRISAAGRLGQARLAVELLTTENPERALKLAEYLEQLNDNRKTVE